MVHMHLFQEKKNHFAINTLNEKINTKYNKDRTLVVSITLNLHRKQTILVRYLIFLLYSITFLVI